MENKRIGFLVNDFELKDDQATTYLLRKISSFVSHMFIFSVKDFQASRTVSALHLDVNIEEDYDIKFDLSGLEMHTIELMALDMIIVRTNPARDFKNHKNHARALDVLETVERDGVPVINSPRALKIMHDKRYLFDLPPSTIPISIEAKNTDDLLKFFKECGNRVVVKPFVGTRGDGVQLLESESEVRSFKSYPILAQEFIDTKDRSDKRVCLFDGEILEIEGVEGVVKRVPQKGEFRSNVCLGATAQPAEFTDADKKTIETVRPWLIKMGLRYVGLDVVGGKIIEINCFSPGGIQDYERFFKKPFGDYIIGSLIEDI